MRTRWIAICLMISMLVISGCGKKNANSGAKSENNSTAAETDANANVPNASDVYEDNTAEGDTGVEELDEDYYNQFALPMSDPEKLWIAECDAEAKKVTFSPMICDMTMVNGKPDIISTVDEDGNTIRMKCEGITISEDGYFFEVADDAKMYLLDSLGGIRKIDVIFAEEEAREDYLLVDGLYSVSGRKSVDSIEQLSQAGGCTLEPGYINNGYYSGLPNYLAIRTMMDMQVSVRQFTIHYIGEYTEIKGFYLNEDFYLYYLEGEKYDPGRENFDISKSIFDFYVNAIPDSKYTEEYERINHIYGVDKVKANNLHRADGSIKSKDEPLEIGDYMDFILDGKTFELETFVLPKSHANSYYEAIHDGVVDAKGDLKVMVIPMLFAGQTWTEEDETELRRTLGRVLEEDGSISEYEPFTGQETVASYFDKASYDKLHINSFVSKPFEIGSEYGDYFTFDYARDSDWNEGILRSLSNWVNLCYGNLTQFDRDGNGLFDLVVVVNPGDMTGYDSYYRVGMGGAVGYRSYYGPELAGQFGQVGINYVAYSTLGALHEHNIRGVDDYDITPLIHEISHMMGLVDYYDVLGGGISAIGGFDMQDHNKGDWNAYSKYAVGWVEPRVVLPSEIEEKGSIEITIDAFEKNGDCIVIPTANAEAEGLANSPFSEYMLIDLFTDEGLYAHDADAFHLKGVTGVRMYHVDAIQEERVLRTPAGREYTIGTHHVVNSHNKDNRYLITLMQASGKKNLIQPDSYYMDVTKTDFFMQGSSFSVKKFGHYFKDGKMNDGSEFPYTITVKSIKDGQAVIVISK